jgi:hypothetical protein
MAAEDHASRRVDTAWNIWKEHAVRSNPAFPHRGLTANEACKLFNDVSLNTVSARVTDLRQANCLLLTGERRRTDKNKWADVHVVNPNATREFFRWWIKERNRLFKLLKPAEAAHRKARTEYADTVLQGGAPTVTALLATTMALRNVEKTYDAFLREQGCPGGVPENQGDLPPFKEA